MSMPEPLPEPEPSPDPPRPGPVPDPPVPPLPKPGEPIPNTGLSDPRDSYKWSEVTDGSISDRAF